MTYLRQRTYDMDKGHEEGLKEGLTQGAHDKAVETARNAFKMNLSIEQVVQLTGLTEEEVSELKQN